MRSDRTSIAIIAILLFSSLVLAQEFRQEVNVPVVPVNPVVPINVVPINGSQSIKPCDVASFSFEVQNPSDQQVTFDLGAAPFEEGVFFSQNPLSLTPGQVKTGVMFVIPPCEQYGTVGIDLIVRSRGDGRVASFPLGVLDISSDGIIEIAKGVSRVRVDYNRSGVFIPVRNIGDSPSTFEFSTEGPSWISVRPSTLALASETQGQIQLISDPPSSLENGVYRVVLFGKAKETGVEYGRQLEVVLAPYTPEELLWNQYKPWLVGGAVVLVLGILGGLLLVLYLVRTRDDRAKARKEKQEIKEQKKIQQEAEREVMNKERMEKGKEAVAKVLLEKFKSEIKKDHVLYTFEGCKVRAWVKPFMWILAVLAVVCASSLLFLKYQDVVAPLVVPWGAGILTVIVVVILILLCQAARARHWRSKYSENELDALRARAKKDLEKEYVLVPNSILSLARKDRPFWLWVAFVAGALIAAIAAIGIAVWKIEVLGGWLAVSGTLGVAAVVLVIVLVSLISHRKKYVRCMLLPFVNQNQKCSVNTDWKEGISEIVIIPKARQSGVLITTQRFDDCPAFIEPDGPVYQFVDMRFDGLTSKDVQDIEVRFKVNKSWLANNRATEKDIGLLRYDASRSRWVRCPNLEVIDSDKAWVSLVAKGIVPGLLAVTARPSLPEHKGFLSRWFSGRDEPEEVETRQFAKLQEAAARRREAKKAEEPSENRWWKWGMYGLVVVVIAAVIAGAIYVAVTQAPPPAQVSQTTQKVQESVPAVPVEMQKKGIPDQAWRQNAVQSLDLSRYFSDPDHDVLLFSNTPIPHILIEYNGSTARLIPETDFVGEASTIFSATDKEGRSVSSNLVRLIVQPGPQPIQKQVLEFVKVYIGYIVAGLISLAVVVASIVLLRKSDEKSEKE